MCSISGCFSLKSLSNNDKKVLKNILIQSKDRGRDSFGYTSFYKKEIIQNIRVIKDSEIYFKSNNLQGIFNVLLSNSRAEPSTEYVLNKTKDDVQPFNDGSIYVAHNGTIANDKELEKKYKLTRKTKIDTAIIPPLLNKLWTDRKPETLAKILRKETIGSYAISIYDTKNPDKFYLATNYKPLYLMINLKTDVIFFTSLEDYFNNSNYNTLYNQYKIMEVKPYTLLEINNKHINSFSLYNKDYEKKTKKKALIICSSGLDSTTCASWAKDKGYDITLLHFHYGARANNAEDKAIKQIANYFNCELVEINTDIFKNVIKHSRLTNPETEGELMKDNEGEKSVELAYEWVPARNLIFMSIAAGYSEAHKFDYIVLGGNLEESGSYADNELIFQRKFNNILPNALNLQNKLEVLTPVANLMKHEIVKMALKLKTPLHLTWSCYENGTIHCGMCGPCLMRRMGFKMNNKIDEIKYKDLPKDFWKGVGK